jgi:hypothetical protein
MNTAKFCNVPIMFPLFCIGSQLIVAYVSWIKPDPWCGSLFFQPDWLRCMANIMFQRAFDGKCMTQQIRVNVKAPKMRDYPSVTILSRDIAA